MPWKLERLEEEAETGRRYLSRLREEVVRLGMLAQIGLDRDTLKRCGGQAVLGGVAGDGRWLPSPGGGAVSAAAPAPISAGPGPRAGQGQGVFDLRTAAGDLPRPAK